MGASRVASSGGWTTQQLGCKERDGADCAQQLWPAAGVRLRQLPGDAIINAISRMAIAARWREPRIMDSTYHGGWGAGVMPVTSKRVARLRADERAGTDRRDSARGRVIACC